MNKTNKMNTRDIIFESDKKIVEVACVFMLLEYAGGGGHHACEKHISHNYVLEMWGN